MPRGRHRKGMFWWQTKFMNAGFRMTLPRQAIMETLSNTTEHLSAEEIYLRVRRKYPGIGLTTVYRTLDILVNMDLIFKFDFGDGRARYELSEASSGAKPHHHHLVCTDCGRVIDYTEFIDDEIELIKNTQKKLSEKYNFKITNHIIQFYGICDKCQQKMS